jgi:hypothetical protein
MSQPAGARPTSSRASGIASSFFWSSLNLCDRYILLRGGESPEQHQPDCNSRAHENNELERADRSWVIMNALY